MMTMLERAVWAAGDVAATMTDDVRHVLSNAAIERVARAVLMAVREPDETLSRAAQSTEGWEAMIEAILSEVAK
ncbi:hypothetical protein [Brevundimonas olei]|uniref:hypothetical protein n=1 Tax=Brevundimonas olei TaxID=657642 RepID=UPI0031CEEE07